MALIGGDRLGEPILVTLGEVFLAGTENVADPVERVILAAAMTVDVLLDAAADLIDSLGGELHHMKRVQHGGGVGELVVDRVLVATERVQGDDLNAVTERVAAGLQPVGIHGAGASRDQIEQPCPSASVLVTGQIDHARQLFRATLDRADVVHDVFVDTQGGHPDEPGLLSGRSLEDRPDRAPHRRPRRAELASHPGHRTVLTAQLVNRPPPRSRRPSSRSTPNRAAHPGRPEDHSWRNKNRHDGRATRSPQAQTQVGVLGAEVW